jgi:hypothetical protein
MCHLQEFHTKFADKGLVVLGFDACDDKKIALEMLQGNGVTFPNIVDASKAADEVCFQKYQRFNMSAVPMSYIIDRNGKVVDAWYGYDLGEPKAILALRKVGGELAESVRRDVEAQVAKSAEAVAAAAQRLFKAIRAADYNRDWTSNDDWKRFLPKDAPYSGGDRRGWVRWVCKRFKANPIVDVKLGKVIATEDGSPTIHFELQLKGGGSLRGDLPFRWDSEDKQWIGWEGLDWHLEKKP